MSFKQNDIVTINLPDRTIPGLFKITGFEAKTGKYELTPLSGPYLALGIVHLARKDKLAHYNKEG